jgi:MarR family transcriptional regulator, lower aerobic nicotinate degradation pathway regulator
MSKARTVRKAEAKADAKTGAMAPAGVLIRRLHQVYLTIYARQCAEFDTTPVQSSIMQVLLQYPGIDQRVLATEIGVDRTTVSDVLRRLEGRGIVKRKAGRDDRRTKLVVLTPAGEAMLVRMQDAIDAAHIALVGSLPAADRDRFLGQLESLVQANNHLGRTALRLK